jgi:NitT/TauT family transport system ATP-binding protein
MNSLSVQIAAKRFANGHSAIAQLAFTARAGEFVAIVGPSGAGKTTLLKIISGLERDFEGSVQLGSEAEPQTAPARIGFMFQEPRLMPWLTVAQNLALVDPSAIGARLAAALDSVGLADCAALFPNQLSGGMQRRVALLRAFMVAPQLLLMDEPFQSLDAPTAEQLRAQLLTLWQGSRATVLFVTHHLDEALALADRVLFLSPGPSHIALDYAVKLPRAGGRDATAVQALAQQLLSEYPDLLRGSPGVNSVSAGGLGKAPEKPAPG